MKIRTLAQVCFTLNTFCVGLLLTRAGGGQTKPPDRGCFIEQLHGSCKLMRQGNGKPIQLDPNRDRYRRVAPGDKLMADGGGSFSLQLNGKVIAVKGPSVWYPVPYVPTAALSASIAALRTSTRIGGRPRGDGLLSPSPSGAVRGGSCVIRWLPQGRSGSMRLEVSDTEGGSVWASENNIMATAGQLDSTSLHAALLAYRNAPRTRRLRLVLTPDHGTSIQIEFRLLSRDEEEALDSELADWNREVGLLRTIGRADSLKRRGMYFEAAQEYEAALTNAPESIALLGEALDAEDLVGNEPRVRELRQHLSRSNQ